MFFTSRHFARWFLLLLGQGTVMGAAPLASHAADRPNFIFIYTDDQRWDALGSVQREQGDKARFPWLQSPNLDRLAADGVRFRNAFVVTSLCAPSRAAFLTGRYGHMNGVVNNHTPFPEDSVTYASLLRQAGYRTAYIGKWHMGSQSGQRPGFDFSASFVGQGHYFDCPIEVNGVTTPSTGWVDDVSTDYALKFLTENKGGPFLMTIGFKTCHGPFEPPPRDAQTYGNSEAREVPNLATPAVYLPKTAAGAKDKDKRATKIGMFRGLKAIDENVGKLLAKLEEFKLTENTMVIYSSDNGYYLGEHHLGDKRSAYDESLRIPLLLRYPKLGRRGVTLDQMVLNIDLAPTLLDFAGVAIPSQMQGRSWKPLLTGDPAATQWRHAYFYSYFHERRFNAPTVTAVRTDTAKLIRYPGHDDWTEMFDLRTDPYETRNLFDDPAHADLRRELEAEYERQAKAADYRVPDFADEASQRSEAQAQNAWVLDYQFDHDAQDRVVDATDLHNDGIAKGTKLLAGGRQGREFDGDGHINVKKTPSLNPAVGVWTIEATFRSDAPEGMVLARGGKTNGYALYLVDGKPTFTYTAKDETKTIAGKKSVEGKQVVVTARAVPGKGLQLSVDDKVVAEKRMSRMITEDPKDEMQIGADLGSPVLKTKVPAFHGVIERVRLFSGEAPGE